MSESENLNPELNQEPKKSGKFVIIMLIILLILAGGYYAYNQFFSKDNNSGQTDVSDDLSLYFANKDLQEQVDKGLTPENVSKLQDGLENYIALQSDENNAYQGYMGEALTYMQLGDYKTSLEKFQALTERYPEDELVFMNLGDLYIKMQQYLEAARAMHMAVEKKPEEVLPHLRLAELYEKYSSDPLRAEDIYQQALLATNGYEEVNKAYATFLEYIKKDYSAAIAVWNQLLEQARDEKLKSSIREKIQELTQKIGE